MSKKTSRMRAIAQQARDASPLAPARQDISVPQPIWPITNAPAELRQVAAICITASVSLFLLQFVANERVFAYFYQAPRGVFDAYWVLRLKGWWVAWALISYLLLPAVVMVLTSGRRLRDCNLGWRGFQQHYWIYVGLYAAVFPVIWFVSLSPDFYTYYPMYGQAGRSWFDLLM